jgi:cyclophilin family peptidyl-prolyl cis-trans isomerase
MPVIAAAHRRALNDANPEARQAVLTVLAAAWRRDSAAFGSWVDSLRRWPAPSDTISRNAARDVTPLAHWRSAPLALPTLADYERIIRTTVLPAMSGRPRVAEFVTARGTMTVQLFGAEAPMSVESLRMLAGRGYFDGLRFHRVVPFFVAQGGDPAGTGSGGPGYTIRSEVSRRQHHRASLGMARSGPDTEGSQWYFTHTPTPHLDGLYTVFGTVTSGWDALDAIVQGDAIIRIRVR